MSTEEISVNFAKNRRNFGDFLKKLPPVGKFWRKIVLFQFISAIFQQKNRNFPTMHRIQNLIMICRQRLCFSAWLKNRGFRVREI